MVQEKPRPTPRTKDDRSKSPPRIAQPNWQALGMNGPEDAEGRN